MVEALQDNAMTALVDGMNAVHTAIRNNAPSGWTVDGNCQEIVHCCAQCGLSTTTGLTNSCALCSYMMNNYLAPLCCNLCNWSITCIGGFYCYYTACLCMDSACFLGCSNVCCIYACMRSGRNYLCSGYMCLTDGTCINLAGRDASNVLCNVIRCYSCTETSYYPYEYSNNCPSCTYCANQCCDIDFTQMKDAIILNAGLCSLGCGTVCMTCTSGSAGSAIPAPAITGDYTACAMERIRLSCSTASICYEGEIAFSVCSLIYLKYCSCPLYVSCGTLTREII